MNYSPAFEMIKRFYDEGRWSIKRVRDAVAKGKITVSEFEEITGEIY